MDQGQDLLHPLFSSGLQSFAQHGFSAELRAIARNDVDPVAAQEPLTAAGRAAAGNARGKARASGAERRVGGAQQRLLLAAESAVHIDANTPAAAGHRASPTGCSALAVSAAASNSMPSVGKTRSPVAAESMAAGAVAASTTAAASESSTGREEAACAAELGMLMHLWQPRLG